MDRPHRMGEPVEGHARNHSLPPLPGLRPAGLLVMIASSMIVAGCNDEPKMGGDTSPAEETALRKQADPASSPKSRTDETRDNVSVRVVGDARLTKLPVASGKLKRMPPVESAEERNLREKARIPEKPDVFQRPLAIDAGTLQSGDVLIRLGGVKAHAADERCASGITSWPCGNFARAALQRFIRSRSANCEGEWKDAGNFAGRCRIASTDISEWVVAQGWAEASIATLKPLEEDARRQGKGLWRKQAPDR